VIGGGFGGLNAARALAGADVQVTLLDRHNYHLFQPLLYQVATASLSPGDVASPIRWVLRRQKNVEVLLADVRAIDPAGKRVLLAPGPAEEGRAQEDAIAYDYLIVASGAAHAYFGHPEWEPHAPGLKTLDDALEMRRRVLMAFESAERETDPDVQRRLLTFVIVGGGPTGVELAGALAEIARQSLPEDFRRIKPESARIVLLEGAPYLLSNFPGPLREASRRSLERLGVEVRTGSIVTGVDQDGVTVETAGGAGLKPRSTSDVAQARQDVAQAFRPAERILAGTILWAAGVAASPIAQSLGVPLDRAGRVTAEPTLALAAHPEIFVVGDICVFMEHGKPLPGVAQVAMQQGTRAGKNVLRAIAGQPLETFRYKNYGIMATIGRGAAVGDVFGLKISGFFAWIFWIFLHIFWLIGFRNRFVVMTEWAWAYLTLQRRVRLITGVTGDGSPPERR
jgi:NADH dehydrogenase